MVYITLKNYEPKIAVEADFKRFFTLNAFLLLFHPCQNQ